MSHCKVHLIFKDFKFEPQTQTFCCNFQRNTLEMFFGDQGRWEPSEMSHFRSVVWRDVRVQAGAKSPEPTSSFRRCCGQSCKNQFCRWVELSEPSHWWWSGLTASKLGLLAEPKLTPSSGAIQAKSSNGEAADGAEVRRDQLTIHTSRNIQSPLPLILRAPPSQAVSSRLPPPSASLRWPSRWMKPARRRSEAKMRRKLVKT